MDQTLDATEQCQNCQRQTPFKLFGAPATVPCDACRKLQALHQLVSTTTILMPMVGPRMIGM